MEANETNITDKITYKLVDDSNEVKKLYAEIFNMLKFYQVGLVDPSSARDIIVRNAVRIMEISHFSVLDEDFTKNVNSGLVEKYKDFYGELINYLSINDCKILLRVGVITPSEYSYICSEIDKKRNMKPEFKKVGVDTVTIDSLVDELGSNTYKKEDMWESYEEFVDGMAKIMAENDGVAVYPPEREGQVLIWERNHPRMWDEIDTRANRYLKKEVNDSVFNYDINNISTWNSYGKVVDACARCMLDDKLSIVSSTEILNLINKWSEHYPFILEDINNVKEAYRSLNKDNSTKKI